MDAEKDYNLLSEIMHNANIGWWKADIQDADYIYYGPIASLLGLEEGGCISFENFNKRILREEQPHTTVRSFDNIQQTNICRPPHRCCDNANNSCTTSISIFR